MDNAGDVDNHNQLVNASHERVKQASQHAVDLIQTYASMDPYSDNNENDTQQDKKEEKETNAWQHPRHILQTLQQARTQLQEAWQEYQTALQNANKNKTQNEEAKLSDDEFRILYMDMITDAFADVLEEMHLEAEAENNTNTTLDVDVLVDCLQSGMELLEEGDRNSQFFLDSMTAKDEGDEDDNESIVPIHQQMQEAMGLHIPPPPVVSSQE